MKNILITLVIVSISTWTVAQTQDYYSVAKIPDSLQQDAHAVVRLKHGAFEILDIDQAKYTFKTVVTILDEKGKEEGYFYEYYDKLMRLEQIKYKVYDKNGKLIKKVKPSEINDRSAISGYSLYEDNRIKWYMLPENYEYPYTVEYSYTLNFKFLYFIPNWFFNTSESVSTQYSSYTLTYPNDVGARYKEHNFNGEKRETKQDDRTSITWRVTGIKCQKLEPYAGAWKDIMPRIDAAPAKFSFEGYTGDMSTWKGFGDWINSLSTDLEPISEPLKQKLTQLTQGKSKVEKIRIIYEYLQENSRYVSIQLGIGGFKPFDPAVVERTGYGDCKALSYFTKAMLEAVNIPSYYTLISAGPNPNTIDKKFPISNFNHVILCVPTQQDTIFLECTSQTNYFGYLGMFTGDRQVLLIHPDGPKIINTTSYPEKQNLIERHLHVQIDEHGNAIIHQNEIYNGLFSGDWYQVYHMPKEDQQKEVKQSINLATFELEDFQLNVVQHGNIELKTNIKANKLLSKAGNRLFFAPNILNKNTFIPEQNSERQNDIVIKYGYQHLDTILLQIPPSYELEAAFEPLNLSSEFGEYAIKIEAQPDGKIRYVRHFYEKKGTFDAGKYQEFLNFHKKIARADQKKIALILKE